MATAGKIVERALQRLGMVGIGDDVPGEYLLFGLEMLQTILQQLPEECVMWTNLSPAHTAVAWDAGTPERVPFPTDYWSDAELFATDENGKPYKLHKVPRTDWLVMDTSATAVRPTHWFEGNNHWFIYPVPSTDPGLTSSYITTPADVVVGSSPDLPKHWELALDYGLAFHMSDHFGKDGQKWFAMWESLKAKAIGATVKTVPLTVELDD